MTSSCTLISLGPMGQPSGMSPEFALALADMRLLQTERLLEWLAAQRDSPGDDRLALVLECVRKAQTAIGGLLEDER